MCDSFKILRLVNPLRILKNARFPIPRLWTLVNIDLSPDFTCSGDCVSYLVSVNTNPSESVQSSLNILKPILFSPRSRRILLLIYWTSYFMSKNLLYVKFIAFLFIFFFTDNFFFLWKSFEFSFPPLEVLFYFFYSRTIDLLFFYIVF